MLYAYKDNTFKKIEFK